MAQSKGKANYSFHGFRLDLARGVLRAPDSSVRALRPKSLALLRHMVENAGRLVGRDEIMAAVWPDVIVTDDSIAQALKEIRRALGDEQKTMLRTLPRQGYPLEADVSVVEEPVGGQASAAMRLPVEQRIPAAQGSCPEPTLTAAAHPATAGETGAAARPTLIVLPFANMSADPEQEYFADGITEDLTTALSHMRWFNVVARNSAFTYKGRAVDVRQVGRDMGVGYVLEGSVRRSHERMRISAQLVDADSGRHVWADRFDGQLDDIFDLQDRVTEVVAGALEPSLRLAEVERKRTRPTASLGAYDLYLRALPQRFVTREGNDEALVLLRRSIALDPGFIAAKGALTGVMVLRAVNLWGSAGDAGEALRCAREVAESAAGEDDPTALAWAGHGLSYFTRDAQAGFPFTERACLLAPNAAMVLMLGGWNQIYFGAPDAALPRLERAMRLSPRDPGLFYFATGLAYAHFLAGRYTEAAKWAQQGARDRPSYQVALRVLAASLMLAGRKDEAATAVRSILALSPDCTVRSIRALSMIREPAFYQALGLAGLPR